MKLLIATHNNKKKIELQRILSPLGIEVVTAEDIGCDLRDVEETGTTFEETQSSRPLRAVRTAELRVSPTIRVYALIILTVSRVSIRHAIRVYTATTKRTLTSF